MSEPSCSRGINCGGAGQPECESPWGALWFMYYIVAQPIVLCVYCCTKDQKKTTHEENCPEMGIALVGGTCLCLAPCVCGFLCAQAEPLFKKKDTPQMPQATMGGVVNPVAMPMQQPGMAIATAMPMQPMVATATAMPMQPMVATATATAMPTVQPAVATATAMPTVQPAVATATAMPMGQPAVATATAMPMQ